MTMLSWVSWLTNRPPSTGMPMATAASADRQQLVSVRMGGNPSEIQLCPGPSSPTAVAAVIDCSAVRKVSATVAESQTSRDHAHFMIQSLSNAT